MDVHLGSVAHVPFFMVTVQATGLAFRTPVSKHTPFPTNVTYQNTKKKKNAPSRSVQAEKKQRLRFGEDLTRKRRDTQTPYPGHTTVNIIAL